MILIFTRMQSMQIEASITMGHTEKAPSVIERCTPIRIL